MASLEGKTKRSTIDDLKFEISYAKKGSPRFTRIIVFFHRALPRNWPRALMRPKPQGHASHFKFPAVPCEFLIRVGSTNDRGRSDRFVPRNDWRALNCPINITNASIMHRLYQYMDRAGRREERLCIKVMAVWLVPFRGDHAVSGGMRGPILRPECFIKYLGCTVLLSDTLQNSCRLPRHGRRLKTTRQC